MNLMANDTDITIEKKYQRFIFYCISFAAAFISKGFRQMLYCGIGLTLNIAQVQAQDTTEQQTTQQNTTENNASQIGATQQAAMSFDEKKCVVSLKAQGKHDYTNCKNKRKNVLLVNDIQLIGELVFPEHDINKHFAPWAIQKVLVDMGLRLPNYLSIDKIHDIALQVSSVYRSFGLAFNTVTLKAQKIEEGIVSLSVANGKLSDVQIYNNSVYTTEQFTKKFEELVGKTLYTPEVKNAMSGIKRFPGVQTFSYYSRGVNQGEVRLNIRVLEQVATQHYLNLDNHGVDQTGKIRLSYAHTLNNPFKRAGQSNIIVTASDGGTSLLGLAQYQMPNYLLDGELSFQIASSQYDVGGEFSILQLQGELVSASLTYTPWQRLNSSSYVKKIIKQLGISFTGSEVKSALPELSVLTQETRYSKMYITPNFPFNFNHKKWKTDLQIRLAIGRLINTEEFGVDKDFSILNVYKSMSREFKIKLLSKIGMERFLWTTQFQYSQDVLPSAETYSMTGLYGVRGYISGLSSPHSAIFSSVALHAKPKRVNPYGVDLIYQPHWFLDISYGIDNLLDELLTDSQSETGFIGTGVGMNMQLYSDWIVNALLAFPVEYWGYSTLGSTEVDPFQLYLSLKYRL